MITLLAAFTIYVSQPATVCQFHDTDVRTDRGMAYQHILVCRPATTGEEFGRYNGTTVYKDKSPVWQMPWPTK